MTDKLRQIIKDELVKLPKESQEVISTFGWESISEEIGKKYLVTENEINDLQREIALILLGIADEDLLSLNIEDRVGTSRNEALKITEEINQKILTPMLKKRELIIKSNIDIKNQSWDKTINFIISGGDYSSFLEQ